MANDTMTVAEFWEHIREMMRESQQLEAAGHIGAAIEVSHRAVKLVTKAFASPDEYARFELDCALDPDATKYAKKEPS